ncbi:HxlR family transcriptional regulator [Nonlabens dokdonensis]|jgi:DNA-binding HxlR family transcriptional regulator|uniref:Transcriptional regulator, HxlR family n=2 Tax=Nonlabens dokdonensis TaxID=328515 RepID=L7WAY2_NONDD|nr:helix-turn-helix domain-containing protein [Nonlabens dokdonensis]AGC76073.1 transcriptional regulator, HxlR family [Nonlabens dokdonensis DSW-6]PZX43745.1 HxlR family transcriptional regulator [Nonlabens dokdonensis]
MKKIVNEDTDCPIKRTLDIIGGKWKLRLISQIGKETRRYGELKKLIPEISEKMLIQELKSLVAFGIVKKKSFKEIPPRVEYTLSEKGFEVLPIIEIMKEFGKAN